jgi:hypothetical protein
MQQISLATPMDYEKGGLNAFSGLSFSIGVDDGVRQ